MAYRRPRPGTKFNVGARIASTSTLRGSKRYNLYSRRGESRLGVTLSAVTGNTDMDDRVRPRSSIPSQRAEFLLCRSRSPEELCSSPRLPTHGVRLQPNPDTCSVESKECLSKQSN